jgi:hypothetical protein
LSNQSIFIDENINESFINHHQCNKNKQEDILGESESENGIKIEKIKFLEKQIFDFYFQKTFLNKNFNFHSFNKRGYVSEQNIEDNILQNKEYKTIITDQIISIEKKEEEKSYLSSNIYEDQEILDFPLSKNDLEENFFFFSNKVN